MEKDAENIEISEEEAIRFAKSNINSKDLFLWEREEAVSNADGFNYEKEIISIFSKAGAFISLFC